MVLRGVERTVIEASTLGRSKVCWEGVRCVRFRLWGLGRVGIWIGIPGWQGLMLFGVKGFGSVGYSSSGLQSWVWESCQQQLLDSTTPLKIHLHDKLRVVVLMSRHGVSFSQPTHMYTHNMSLTKHSKNSSCGFV